MLAFVIPIDGSGFERPGNALPQPWPHPPRPDQGLPGDGWPGHPSTGPVPPGGGQPPMASHPIVLPPGQSFPPGVSPPIVPPDPPPGSIWPPIQGQSGKAVIIVAVPGYGVKYVVVDLAQPK